MKKPAMLALAGCLFLSAGAIADSGKAECLRAARVSFKSELLACKDLDGKHAKKQCVKEARVKVKAAKRACRA